MEPNQNQKRHAAAFEFQQSLEQLENILQENPAEEEVVIELDASSGSNGQVDKNLPPIDLEALEEAVADIEQYLEQKKK